MPEALPYHFKVVRYFKDQPKTWEFFALAKTRADQLNDFKVELLKNTYKFTPASDPGIYEKVETAKNKLALSGLPINVYQAQFSDEINASIVFLENEAHIVFSGRIMQLLSEDELLAVIAHELAHIKLYTMMGGDLEIATRIITAIANNSRTEASYAETARLFHLYTEIFCDRGAFDVLGDINPVISSLVKIATGLEKVSTETYLEQAVEILNSAALSGSNTLTHPENFMRARAIQLWKENKDTADESIVKLIEGSTSLDSLDIFKQTQMAALTRTFLQLFLKPKWFQTTQVLSLARQFFPDFKNDEKIHLTPELLQQVNTIHEGSKDYLCYVLLDFVLVDGSLENIPFGWAFQFAEDLLLKDNFDQVVKKEFKFSDKKLQQHKQRVLASYYEVKESSAEQVYED